MGISRRQYPGLSGSSDLRGYDWAYRMLQDSVLAKMNGCASSGCSDANDWLKDCDTATKLYWAVNEITVLLKILT